MAPIGAKPMNHCSHEMRTPAVCSMMVMASAFGASAVMNMLLVMKLTASAV